MLLLQDIGDALTHGVIKKYNMARKNAIDPHKCFDCKFSYLMQSIPVNPIVSECTITKTREVASTLLKCEHFKPRVGEAVIHPMIHCRL